MIEEKQAALAGNVLGIAESASGRAWLWRNAAQAVQGDELERRLAVMGRESGLGDIACRVLAGRGIAAEKIKDFLDPRLRLHLPDPSSLKDMNKAAARLAQAVEAKEIVGKVERKKKLGKK